MTPTRIALLGATLLAACGQHAKQIGNTGALAMPSDPRLITMTVEPTTTLVAANTASPLGMRVQIKAGDLPDARRPRLNLALILDTSGSMEGGAIAAVRNSAGKLVSQMRDGDRVSVVAFHSRGELLVPPSVLEPRSRARVMAAIDHITAHGTTDLTSGLSIGLAQIQSSRLANGINRIVLLSDGVPNTSAALPSLIANAHTTGIGITTLGLGVDYDSTLLAQMARDTGGTFHFIEKPEQVADVFDQELSRMSTVVGRNLSLVLTPGPGVVIQPMPGLAVGPDGHAVATIGDLAAGEQRDLMIPIKVAARGDGSTAELADAALTFDDVIAQSGRQQRDGYASVKASADQAAVAAAVKIDLEVQRIRIDAASAILESIALARRGDLAGAQHRLELTTAIVRAASTRLSDPDLAKIGDQLDEVGKQLAQLVPAPVVIIPEGNVPYSDERQPMVAPAAVETTLRHTEDAAQKAVTGRKRR